MFNSSGGIGDVIQISVPGYEQALEDKRQEWITKIPNCPTCGVKMEQHGAWRNPHNKPKVMCVTVGCTGKKFHLQWEEQ